MVLARIIAIKNREKHHIDKTLTHFLFRIYLSKTMQLSGNPQIAL